MHKTKRKIFEKSIELFANKGYEATSIEEITSVVGIAKGTLYYHFESKEEIYNFLITEGMNLLKNSIEIKTAKLKNSIDKIKAIILIQIKVSVKYEGFVRLLLSEMWGNEKRNIICKNCIKDYIKIIENIVQEGLDKKEINGGNSTTIAYGIFGVICSCLISNQNARETINIQELYKEFSEYIVKGLK
ncbi:MAG: TetR/AcrR family transcriptional regulator [Clostridia bacterium]|nr:TetR/AcrR family transcriptional regulator [Clostridia bacterium]